MIRLNWPWVKRLILRFAWGRYIGMDALAKRTIVLCPEEIAILPKAIYLESSLERINALSPWRSWSREQLLIHGGKAEHSASRAYLVEDVNVFGSFIYSGPATDKPGFGPEQLLLKEAGNRKDIDRANLVTTWGGSHFFGALLLDDFIFELNADDPENNIRMRTKPYKHEATYRKLLGLNHSSLIEYARVGRLTLYSEPYNNSLRANRYRVLRRRLRQSMGGGVTCAATGVYLKRGRTGEDRLLENEHVIETYLERNGFDIVEPDALMVEEIVRRTMDAPVVISVEGSHISHILFTIAEKGALVVLQPPDRFSTVYKEFTDCMGMRFAFIVGLESSGGFIVPLDEMKRVLELIVS